MIYIQSSFWAMADRRKKRHGGNINLNILGTKKSFLLKKIADKDHLKNFVKFTVKDLY